MGSITSLSLVDSFNTFMTRVNSIITKLNTYTSNSDSALTLPVIADPSASQANNTAVLFFDSANSNKLTVKVKDSGGTVVTYVLSTTS